VIDAKAAGFEADRGGGRCDLVGLNGKFQTFEALDIGPAPKQNGCVHDQDSCAVPAFCIYGDNDHSLRDRTIEHAHVFIECPRRCFDPFRRSHRV
jgi:hypothetical protein